ncbi:MAG: hypothetical protein FWB72_00135 [Firmicutes bacterium]|nr:hypothetical protein [Bacillota bacterium]
MSRKFKLHLPEFGEELDEYAMQELEGGSNEVSNFVAAEWERLSDKANRRPGWAVNQAGRASHVIRDWRGAQLMHARFDGEGNILHAHRIATRNEDGWIYQNGTLSPITRR